MKRFWMFFFVVALCISAAFAVAGDGTKTYTFLDQTYVVPNCFPEFMKWEGEVKMAAPMGPEMMFVIIEAVNTDKTVGVQMALFVDKGRAYVMGVAVRYAKSDKMDLYEDVGLISTGKPSMVLTQVPQLSDATKFFEMKIPTEKIKGWKI